MGPHFGCLELKRKSGLIRALMVLDFNVTPRGETAQVLLESRTADVLLAALNSGDVSPTKANLLIDSDIHKTLLAEEQWERPLLRGANRMPTLAGATKMMKRERGDHFNALTRQKRLPDTPPEDPPDEDEDEDSDGDSVGDSDGEDSDGDNDRDNANQVYKDITKTAESPERGLSPSC